MKKPFRVGIVGKDIALYPNPGTEGISPSLRPLAKAEDPEKLEQMIARSGLSEDQQSEAQAAISRFIRNSNQ